MQPTLTISEVLHESGRNLVRLVAEGKTVRVVKRRQVLFYAMADPAPPARPESDVSDADLKRLDRALCRLAEWPEENPVLANRKRETR